MKTPEEWAQEANNRLASFTDDSEVNADFLRVVADVVREAMDEAAEDARDMLNAAIEVDERGRD